MKFSFEGHEPTDMQRVNEALSGMRLSDVCLTDHRGYVYQRTPYDPKTPKPLETTYQYGFTCATLKCNEDSGDGVYTWQMDVQAFPKDQALDTDKYREMWRSQHPDRAMRVLMKETFECADVFMVLHHEKPDD